MNTDFDKQPEQRRRFLLVSGVAVAVCLFVVALRERRRRVSATAARTPYRADRFAQPTPTAAEPASAAPASTQPWAPAGHVGDPVWETFPQSQADRWPAPPATPEPEAELYDIENQAEVEVEGAPIPDEAPRAEVEVEVEGDAHYDAQAEAQAEAWQYPVPQGHGWQPAQPPYGEPAQHAETEGWEIEPEADPQQHEVETEVEPESALEAAPVVHSWFGGPVAAESSETPWETPAAQDVDGTPEHEVEVAPVVHSWFGSPAPEAPAESPETPVAQDVDEAFEPEVAAEAPVAHSWFGGPVAEETPVAQGVDEASEPEVAAEAPVAHSWFGGPVADESPETPVAQDVDEASQPEVAPEAPVVHSWFGSPAPAESPETPSESPAAQDVAQEPEAEVAPAAPVVHSWFGSPAPAETPETPSETPTADVVEAEAAPTEQAAPVDDESVIELPPVAEEAVPEQQPKKLPPPLLRRFMGTGATVLVLGLVLCAGVLASGATADSTSDPATVPDAVGTTAPLPAALPDTTTDTTSTDTTSTDTTTTDTTTTDTTTTDTTTTDTTPTTTTPTTTTDTTSTSTTPTDTTTTTTPTDTTPADPPASDPAAVPAAPATPDASAPSATPATPAVDVAPPTTPVVPKPTTKSKVTPHHHKTVPAPPKATTGATPSVGSPASSGTPAASGTPVVTLASGADAIGSILSAHSAIPAVDAALLPTPAQVSFYVKASKPLAPLPTLARIDHPVVQRLVTAGRHDKVAWTVLAAVSRLESNLGTRPGPIAGRALSTAPTGDGLGALASFLRAHGATKNPLTPMTAKKALTLYFGGSTRKADRVIALAALYGALGPAGLQHGVRAETALLQRRVLADHRVHLTVAGRSDIRHGRVDPRVLVTLEYLANSFRKVGVSDLVSGGALFSRSGSVSAHLYGRAADVASLHGKVVRGHQGPGTMTEQAIRKLLLLPKSLRPRQVISLMDVDGPTGNHGSFALPDHYDRIQIDY
ncbi:MAG: hypothetical protein QOI43_2076 [Gaiellales bacterium]|nr:hypothetical protein [Gaiellales bacterium]